MTKVIRSCWGALAWRISNKSTAHCPEPKRVFSAIYKILPSPQADLSEALINSEIQARLTKPHKHDSYSCPTHIQKRNISLLAGEIFIVTYYLRVGSLNIEHLPQQLLLHLKLFTTFCLVSTYNLLLPLASVHCTLSMPIDK